jgi:hypothetical protein
MEMMTEQIQMGVTGFSAMVFLVWILPGMVCRKGSFPEDRPTLK